MLSKPTWSVKSLLESHDHIQKNNKATGDQEAEITPETINQLLTLAHLHKPEDPQELERLQRDLKNMRNFLKSIQSHGTDQQGDSTRPLKSLVDDGHGLAMRPTQLSTEEEKVDEEANTDANRSRRRDTLLKRAQMVKGNFFVVETVLDPEKDN
ncbi:hypothetical protein BGW38_007716 [Lunasporangiospora selenospora]|uniref:Uncharacterized protein n=1 Tax=Lunasporangiospora selenospora TaxID=979761 RepID=A0A9P6FZ04_9FUNG|nr:hypothetical protein BGW38_007716 [Lunasporangiospora selenospora]